MHKRMIVVILIALTIATPAASQHFTIIDCDGIQVEHIGMATIALESLCSPVRQTAAVAEVANMELLKFISYNIEGYSYLTFHLVLDHTDDLDISTSTSLMVAGNTYFICIMAAGFDVTLIYDVDLRVDTGDGALLFDLTAGSMTCPDGDIDHLDHTLLYNHSRLSWHSLVEYTPE